MSGRFRSMQPAVVAGMKTPRTARKMRRPTYRFGGNIRPWSLVPMVAAPVVPGETMKQVLFQARALSSPLTYRLGGAWFETYWFYIKHRHMRSAEDYVAMMLDLSATAPAGTQTSAAWGTTANHASFVREAYEAVVNAFFRDEKELETLDGDNDGYINVRARTKGWWDSVLPTIDLVEPPGIGDDTIGSAELDTIGEVGRALETWNMLRAMGIQEMSYDDYLRAMGVSLAQSREELPEFLRSTQEWVYPANTVTVGADNAQQVSAVWNWQLAERIDKDRFFPEPGLILGLCVVRPQTWTRPLVGTTLPFGDGVNLLKDALGWQAPLRSETSYEAYRPVPGRDVLAFDPKDVFIHGDERIVSQVGTFAPNYTHSAQGIDSVTGALVEPDTTAINSLFTGGANGYVQVDLVANVHILSGAIGPDTTPRTIA